MHRTGKLHTFLFIQYMKRNKIVILSNSTDMVLPSVFCTLSFVRAVLETDPGASGVVCSHSTAKLEMNGV